MSSKASTWTQLTYDMQPELTTTFAALAVVLFDVAIEIPISPNADEQALEHKGEPLPLKRTQAHHCSLTSYMSKVLSWRSALGSRA